MDRQYRRRNRILFWCYSIVMLWLLFGQRMGDRAIGPYWEVMRENVNLDPFHTIGNYLSVIQWTRDPGMIRHIVVNLVGNVALFIPLGILLPLNWRWFHSIWKLILLTALVICLIEVIQLVTLLGSLDVDDLILNVFGTVIGYFLWLAMRKK